MKRRWGVYQAVTVRLSDGGVQSRSRLVKACVTKRGARRAAKRYDETGGYIGAFTVTLYGVERLP